MYSLKKGKKKKREREKEEEEKEKEGKKKLAGYSKPIPQYFNWFMLVLGLIFLKKIYFILFYFNKIC